MKKRHPILSGISGVKPYTLATSASLYEVRPPIMQIEDFLPAAGLMGLTSQPGVGKTWLGLEVVRAVAAGVPFLGRFKTLRGGVLFVGSDSSVYDYARQWTRLTREQSESDPGAFDPVRFLIQEDFLFEDRDAVRRLIATHRRFEWGETTFGPGNEPQRERGFHVIVFDTLSALTNVPENDNTGREQVFRMIRLIAEVTDCAVIILHHNAAKSEFNDGTNFRGGTAQLGRLDSHVNLIPSRRDPYLIGVTYKKFRGIKPRDFSYRMEVSDPLVASLVHSGDPVTLEQRMQFDPLADAVAEYVAQHPGSHAVDIRDALWPRFEVGVAGPGNVTSVFATLEKLGSGVHNRLNALLRADRLTKQGKNNAAVYYPAADPGLTSRGQQT